jgi:hypothetical protein
MKKSRWIVDSGCSRHLIRNHNVLTKFKENDKGNVIFSNNDKSKIVGIGNLEYENSNMIENILLVNGLEDNLLSVRQLCDKGHKVTFDLGDCIIASRFTNEVKFIGHRKRKISVVKLLNHKEFKDTCLITFNKES